MSTEVARKPVGQVSGKSKKVKRGRPKALRISVRSLEQITALVERYQMPAGVLTYRDIAKELSNRSGIRITTGTLYRLAHGIEPTRERLRQALNLPVSVTVPVCPACGIVHTKRCPANRQPPKPRTKPTRREHKIYAILGQLWLPGRKD